MKGAKERTVAVKKLHALPAGAEPIREFCKEVVLMQRMDHRNLLPLLGVWMPPDGSFAMVPRNSAQFGAIFAQFFDGFHALLQVTELCPRGSLFDYLHAKKGGRKLPPALTMRLLLDTAAGVRHLHEATPRCIHRDLKCQNLLLGSGMELKVADFGLSRECFATAAMTRVGSVQWAAPEVLLGKKYSHKCDLWALGVVCWEILTARVPFEGMGPGAIATKVACQGMRLPVPTGAPMPLLKLMAKCWVDKPTERPEMKEVMADLQAELDALPTKDQAAVGYVKHF